DEESARSMLIHGCECTFDFAFAAGANHKHFHPERMGSRLRRSQFDATVRVVWIHEISEGSDLRHQLVQQLQSLSYGGRPKYGDTGDIAARLIEARELRRSRPPVGVPGRHTARAVDHACVPPSGIRLPRFGLRLSRFLFDLAETRPRSGRRPRGDAVWTKPTTGTTGCCARAVNGHAAAAPPRNVMNSRRLIAPQGSGIVVAQTGTGKGG